MHTSYPKNIESMLAIFVVRVKIQTPEIVTAWLTLPRLFISLIKVTYAHTL